MIARPKVCTKSGEWIELDEAQIKLRSNLSQEGKQLDDKAENPELLKVWFKKLRVYNSEAGIERAAEKAGAKEVKAEAPKDEVKKSSVVKKILKKKKGKK